MRCLSVPGVQPCSLPIFCRHSFAERVFLCNSGAEANEAAMKLARRWGSEHGGRYEILSTTGSFHGRTFATLTATGQEKYHQGFQPLLPGIRLVAYDDAAALAAVDELARPALLQHVREVGAYFADRLRALAAKLPVIREVRGVGLMLGAELTRPGAAVVERCLRDGLLINCCADRVLRFVPPLVITRAQVDEGFVVLERALATA